MGYIGDTHRYFYINDINCTGTEHNLQECPVNNLTNYRCQYYRDAGVSCNSKRL